MLSNETDFTALIMLEEAVVRLASLADALLARHAILKIAWRVKRADLRQRLGSVSQKKKKKHSRRVKTPENFRTVFGPRSQSFEIRALCFWLQLFVKTSQMCFKSCKIFNVSAFKITKNRISVIEHGVTNIAFQVRKVFEGFEKEGITTATAVKTWITTIIRESNWTVTCTSYWVTGQYRPSRSWPSMIFSSFSLFFHVFSKQNCGLFMF